LRGDAASDAEQQISDDKRESKQTTDIFATSVNPEKERIDGRVEAEGNRLIIRNIISL